jgi:hypothetical protein
VSKNTPRPQIRAERITAAQRNSIRRATPANPAAVPRVRKGSKQSPALPDTVTTPEAGSRGGAER